MDDTWTLLLLSLAMLVGCYVAGAVPLAFTLSEERLRQVTVLGAGLLVGTALAVIIPEGVHTMYDAHSQKPVSLPSTNVEIAAKDVVESDHSGHSHASPEMHTWIGMALVLGFVFMLLVDQIGGRGHSHSHVPSADAEGGSTVVMNRNKITATLGLVVHAAADGIALGAAASTSQTHVEMIVFIAIMLHKAPAAFGLVSFLMHEGFDRARIRKHLAIFSSAAPIGAIITYFGISQSSKESLAHLNITGIAMLFSGGTFLYVATVHILPELEAMGSRTVLADGSVITKEQKGFTKLELCLMVTGSILPLLLSLGHHH